MAILNGKYKVKNSQNSYDVVHLETSASQVKFDDGKTFQEKLEDGTLKGAKGDKGDSYILTATDKEEIAQLAKPNTDEFVTESELDDELSKISTVSIGDTEPTNENTNVWLNPYDEEEIEIAVIDDTTISTDTVWSSSNTNKKINSSLSNYATKSYVDSVVSGIGIDGVIPDYVKDEAQKVADKVMATRNAYSLVIGATSDLHTNGADTESNFIQHTGMGMNEVNKLTQLDLFAILGDICIGKFDEQNKDGFEHVRRCFYDVIQQVPMVQTQGNHDELGSDTTAEARQKYASFIGSNNIHSVVDFENKFRNYGYIDFDYLRFRVIHLNSADTSEYEVTEDNIVSKPQFQWLINKALDFSDKEGTEDWHFVVMCHHPLNAGVYMVALKDLLQAYITRASGTVTVGNYNIPYDFTNAKQRFVCHLHGHIHNFRTEWFEDVLSITIPNACFSRNNEYGTYAGYDEWIHENFGDKDSEGNQRQFNKVKGTAQDTAFNVLVIDSRVENVIHAFNYGAGIDRTISLDSAIYYTVSFVGQNYVSSNQATTAKEQVPYTTTISSHGGYLLESLVVTMGGIDITSDVVSDGVINIPSVTGDIKITVTTKADDSSDIPTGNFTNQIPLSVDVDGSLYVGTNGEDGYKAGYRVSSTGLEVQVEGMYCSGYIPCTAGQVIRIANITIGGPNVNYLAYYNSDKTFTIVNELTVVLPPDDEGVYTGNCTRTGFIRICCGGIDSSSILTLDEPINLDSSLYVPH